MSSRRMFSTKITTSAPFLKMPLSAQALYFHLGLNTDDDGVVEGFSIIRMLSASEDDLQLLINKGFVKVLNEDLVLFITHWHEHNLIRADRKVDSIYKDLLLKVVSDIKLVEPRKRSDLKVKATSVGQPVDVQMTPNGQHKISKVKLSKVNIIEDNINIIIDYYCQKTDRPKTTDKVIIKNITEILKSYSIDDCKKVIDFIIVDKWYKDNGYDTLSSIFKPTKFSEKLERALVYKPNIADKLKNISQQDFNTGGVF